jgi:release factor glutamine methyltransferase
LIVAGQSLCAEEMTIEQQLESATAALASVGLPTPRLDAEVLLASYLKKDRVWLFVHSERRLSPLEAEDFRRWVLRRQQREPVAYLVGHKEFWSLDFAVDSRVLIPRPDTEVLVEEVLNMLALHRTDQPEILELGTGSGAIAVALASELPEARITATDLSPEALAVAAGNADRHSLTGRIEFLQGNLFAPVKGRFDVIVSNPPYIAAEDYVQLPDGVRNFEPREALLAGKEGMDYYVEIIPQAASFLKPGGWLLLEIGAGQKERIEGLFSQSGLYRQVTFRKDYAGHWRVVKAGRKEDICG